MSYISFFVIIETIENFEATKLVSSLVKLIMSGKVEDKKGNPIEVGDTVFTKIRGGKREGEVTYPITLIYSWLAELRRSIR